MPIIDLTTQPQTAAKAEVIVTNGAPLDGDWDIAIDCRKTATKRETRLWVQCEKGLAIPLTFREDTITTPTHSTAIAQPDGSYRHDLGDLKLSYRTTLNAQNEASMAMTFPAGLITRVDLEGQDTAGTALELGGQAISLDQSNLNMNPFMGNSLVTQILWKITYKDGSVVNYLVPLTR